MAGVQAVEFRDHGGVSLLCAASCTLREILEQNNRATRARDLQIAPVDLDADNP